MSNSTKQPEKHKKRPRRQVGTIGWVMEMHLEATGHLRSIERNEVDPIETISKIGDIQRMVNSWTKHLSTGLDYKKLVISAIDIAIENAGKDDGVSEQLRETWEKDIKRLSDPSELEKEVVRISRKYPDSNQSKIREFYANAVEQGEPFLRGQMKERLVGVRKGLLRK